MELWCSPGSVLRSDPSSAQHTICGSRHLNQGCSHCSSCVQGKGLASSTISPANINNSCFYNSVLTVLPACRTYYYIPPLTISCSVTLKSSMGGEFVPKRSTNATIEVFSFCLPQLTVSISAAWMIRHREGIL